MTVRKSAFLVCFAVLVAAGCGEPPKSGDTVSSKSAGEGAGEGTSYDPAKDPAVNPPSLTQKFDASEATEDEWMFSTLDGNPQTLNPLFASSTYEFRFADLLWNGPFTFDAKMDWAVNKELVEKLDVSADNRVWTLKLKPGYTWQDGVPYTAHDIVYSWKEQLDERVP